MERRLRIHPPHHLDRLLRARDGKRAQDLPGRSSFGQGWQWGLGEGHMFLRKVCGVCHTQALGRLRQESHKFKTSLGFIVKLCLKTKSLPQIPVWPGKERHGQTCRSSRKTCSVARVRVSCDEQVEAGQDRRQVVTVTGRMLLAYLQ